MKILVTGTDALSLGYAPLSASVNLSRYRNRVNA